MQHYTQKTSFLENNFREVELRSNMLAKQHKDKMSKVLRSQFPICLNYPHSFLRANKNRQVAHTGDPTNPYQLVQSSYDTFGTYSSSSFDLFEQYLYHPGWHPSPLILYRHVRLPEQHRGYFSVRKIKRGQVNWQYYKSEIYQRQAILHQLLCVTPDLWDSQQEQSLKPSS